jgi:hypothetical protein
MQFSAEEMQWAKHLRDLGLCWEPRPGHYVWDETGCIEQPSPFQEGVYFILDLKHFLRRTGTLDALKAAMIWLPTWHDARDILAAMGVKHAVVAEALQAQTALEHREELLALYRLIASHLRKTAQTAGRVAPVGA